MLLIIAGNFQQAHDWARKRRLDRREWKYIATWSEAVGFSRDAEYACVGTFYERPEIGRLIDIVRARYQEYKG